MACNKYPEDKRNTPFASALRELMDKRGVTQGDLAKVTGKTRQTISQYVNGISEPGYDTLVVIADYFNISSDYLLGIAPAPERKPCAANELGLKQEYIDILSLVAKINASDVHYAADGTYLLTDEMKQLLPILEANRFLELFEDENRGISMSGQEHKSALSAIVFSRLMVQFVGDMVNAARQNGRILRDYDGIPTVGEIDPPQSNTQLETSALAAGFELIPAKEYARFKSSEIGKAIDRYLFAQHVEK